MTDSNKRIILGKGGCRSIPFSCCDSELTEDSVVAEAVQNQDPDQPAAAVAAIAAEEAAKAEATVVVTVTMTAEAENQ